MVSFPEAFKRGIKNCCTLNVKGRSPRSEYWWFVLFWFILYVISGASVVQTGFIIAFILVTLAFYGGLIIVGVRRLHDLNATGMFILIPVVGDMVTGVFNSTTYFDPNLLTIISRLNWIIKLVFICVFCHKGTEGPNRYGPDPLAK